MFSCAARKEGHCKQTSLASVGCARSVWATLGLPPLPTCAFPVYTAQAPGCPAGNCLRQALGCVHFPGLSRSGSGSRVLHKGADSIGPSFVPSQVRAAQAPRCLARAVSPGGGCVLSPPQSQPLGFLRGSGCVCLRCALRLLWGAGLRLRPCILLTFRVPVPWFPGCAAGAPSQVCRVSPLGC